MKHFISPQFPATAPTLGLIADARAVVANPEQYHDRPLLRRIAWMTLMTSRGLKSTRGRKSPPVSPPPETDGDTKNPLTVPWITIAIFTIAFWSGAIGWFF